LISTSNILGGVDDVVEISNDTYMRHPVSPVFHGRDIFCPAAAYLTLGTDLEEFGKKMKVSELVKAPYKEARVEKNQIEAQVISSNKFGSIVLNILHSVWDKLGVKVGDKIRVEFGKKKIEVPFVQGYGDVPLGKPLILKDDYFRIEIAIN